MDAKIVTEMSSYLVLHKTCYDVILKEKMPERGTPIPDIPINTFKSSNVIPIPLLFELLPLILKSSFIVSVYPMLISLSAGLFVLIDDILLCINNLGVTVCKSCKNDKSF